MRSSYIIAEVGSNWRGTAHGPGGVRANLEHSYEQILLAKQAGADAVKFQLFTARELYGHAVDAATEKRVDQWALPREFVPCLSVMATDIGIDFMCSAFSPAGYMFVDPSVKMHKIASSEATAVTILECVERLNKPTLLSLGIADSAAYGFIAMACVMDYPALESDYRLELLPPGSGLSDHTIGTSLAVRARQLGYTYFEKHVDLVGAALLTPDGEVSLNLDEFKEYVAAVRSVSPIAFDSRRRTHSDRYARRKSADGEYYRPLS